VTSRRDKCKVAVVIPAYNEAERVGRVLEAAAAVEGVDEIVVVDDGSTDDTAEVARSFGARVIRNERNLGKGGALQAGFRSTGADIVCTLDADLVGLTPGHVERLLSPLFSDSSVEMTVGKFSGGRARTSLAQGLAKSLSGQRAIRRGLIERLPDLGEAGFGVETLVTKSARSLGARIEIVELHGAGQVMKEEKLGVRQGLAYRMKMYSDIAGHLMKKTPPACDGRRTNRKRPGGPARRSS